MEVKNLKWLNRYWFSYPTNSKVRITLEFNVNDRDTGKSKPIWVCKTFKRSYFKSTKQIAGRIRALAKFFVCHEIDESIYFDNVRIFDPHL